MKITDDNIEHAVDYIIITVAVVAAAVLMISLGNALTAHLPIT